jgi:hypothetical protein
MQVPQASVEGGCPAAGLHSAEGGSPERVTMAPCRKAEELALTLLSFARGLPTRGPVLPR